MRVPPVSALISLIRPPASAPTSQPEKIESPAAILELHGLPGLKIALQKHLEKSVLDKAREAIQAPAPDEADPIPRLLEYFSPEKTARRIAEFVTAGFERTSFGDRGDRGGFVDFILPYIRSGVDKALAAFGDALPDEAREQAESTFEKTRALLGEFAAA